MSYFDGRKGKRPYLENFRTGFRHTAEFFDEGLQIAMGLKYVHDMAKILGIYVCK